MEEREERGGAVRVGMIWGGIGGGGGLLVSLLGSLGGGLVAGFFGLSFGEKGCRCGKSGRRALRAGRRGRRCARVRAWVHARGAPCGAPDRGRRDRHDPLGCARYADLGRRGLDLLPVQPHSLCHPRGRCPDPGLIGRRSLGEKGVERASRRPAAHCSLAASAACSPKTNPPSSGRVTPALSRRRSFWYFLMAAFRVPRPRVAHLGREATTWRPSCSIISW